MHPLPPSAVKGAGLPGSRRQLAEDLARARTPRAAVTPVGRSNWVPKRLPGVCVGKWSGECRARGPPLMGRAGPCIRSCSLACRRATISERLEGNRGGVTGARAPVRVRSPRTLRPSRPRTWMPPGARGRRPGAPTFRWSSLVRPPPLTLRGGAMLLCPGDLPGIPTLRRSSEVRPSSLTLRRAFRAP